MPVVPKTYTCTKCGRPFTKNVSGIVMTPADAELLTNPLCNDCKKKNKPWIKKKEIIIVSHLYSSGMYWKK